MTRARTFAAVAFGILTAASPALAQQANPMMSFFVTSVGGGKGANHVADLHSDKNNIGKMTAPTEKGDMLPGRADGAANIHDILTGTQPDGNAYPGENSANSTCGNWVRYFPMSGK